jgi:hypothetical protein
LSLTFIVIGNVLLTFISETSSFLAIEPGAIFWAVGASIGFPALYIVALSGINQVKKGSLLG